MKFLFTILFTFLFSVSFLFFLLNNDNFLPRTSIHEIDWTNFSVFTFLLFTTVFSFFNIIFYIIKRFFKKNIEERKVIKECIKYSSLLTFSLLIVFLLHIFHVISFFWGLGIFLVVLFLIFVV